MSTDSALKVDADHLRRDAFLYVRQSSLRQVFENTESTKRQYALRERAVALGWPIERIHVIDSDLGLSGAQAARSRRLPAPGHRGRTGPRRHRARAGGLAPGAQQRRLASPARTGALSHTLILDEDGVYDPAHFNDRLLLGLKGTMSEAELHVLQVAAARRHPQQGAARRARDRPADRPGLRRRRPRRASIRIGRSRTPCGWCSRPSARPARPCAVVRRMRAQHMRSRGASVAASARGRCCGVSLTILGCCRSCTTRATPVPSSMGARAATYNAELQAGPARCSSARTGRCSSVTPTRATSTGSEFERNQVTLQRNAVGFSHGPARRRAARGHRLAARSRAVRALRCAHARALRTLGMGSCVPYYRCNERSVRRAEQQVPVGPRHGDRRRDQRAAAADGGARRRSKWRWPCRKRSRSASSRPPHCARRSCSAPAMKPNSPVVATSRSIPTTGWWPMRWRPTGTSGLRRLDALQREHERQQQADQTLLDETVTPAHRRSRPGLPSRLERSQDQRHASASGCSR